MDGDFIKLERPGSKTHVYTALSYCWGESRIDTTTRINVEARMSPFFLNKLPPTLQDAIVFTRHLKIQYIWIDAICIVQDCAKEWSSEAQKMMEYYQHARVTIVPVDSNSADSGMSLGYGPYCRNANSILGSAWNNRGWTYQEKLNSSRVLFVFRDELRLECRAGSFETKPGWKPTENNWLDFLPTSSTITDRDIRDVHDDWCHIVQRYAERSLTQSKDRWFAFSGIAEAFQKASGRQIIAGFWEEKILDGIVSWVDKHKSDPMRPIHLISNFTSSSSG
ncbi:heterokaryon incompatibility protein-domain-containing protein, partial [Xylaria flabelliformis]